MTVRIHRTLQLMALTTALAVAALPLAPHAAAAEAKVLVGTYAWYWQDQQSQKVQDPSGTDVATAEAPNPFCPGPGNGLGAPSETCREGRLPVQVRGGDYEEPNKISAVAFDLALVPIGSKVKSFKVTFLEANDDQSRPVNAEDRKLQACLVEEFFGEGEARPYKTAPDHTCSNTDPTAKRKPVKGKDDRFEYTFDLTDMAAGWVAEGAPATAIMLYPVEPKNPGPADNAWRVVLDGPLENNGKSIKAKISYTPPPEESITIDPGTLGGDLGGDLGTTGGDFSTTTSGGDFGMDAPSLESGAEAPEPVAEEAEPVEAGGDEEAAVASAPLTTNNETPWYVWVALLAGLIGFSMVRSVVLESHAGIRPDGVLAQIRQINADRRGAPIESLTSGASPFAPVLGALAAVGRRGRAVINKLPKIRTKG